MATMSTPTTTERALTTADGQVLHYAVSGSTDPDAPVVTFVHGWPDSWRSFGPVMEALPAGVRAIAVSLRGFGGSTAPASGYAPADLAADVVAVMDHEAVATTTIVGHSMGTVVAQRLALDHAARVRGLVLIGAFAHLDPALGDEVWGVLEQLAEPVDPTFVEEFQAGTLAQPVSAERFAEIVAESLRAPLAVWRATFGELRGLDHGPELGRITAPTLLLWGDQDALIPRSQQELLVASLPAARLVVYPGAGHSPNWEEPARVAGDVAAFVADLP